MEKKCKIIFCCDFCNRKFKSERWFASHTCKKRERFYSKDKPEAIMAYFAWDKFYQRSMPQHNNDYRKDYNNFINSQFYDNFLEFGKYVKDSNVLEPEKYINYVLENNIPIKKWYNDITYDAYIKYLLRKESAEDAITRTIMFMTEWSQKTDQPWNDFFRKIGPGEGVFWIKSGKISPWMLYNAESAIDFLEKCSPEQLSLIKAHAPIGPWKIRFGKHPESCKFIKQTLKENGI